MADLRWPENGNDAADPSCRTTGSNGLCHVAIGLVDKKKFSSSNDQMKRRMKRCKRKRTMTSVELCATILPASPGPCASSPHIRHSNPTSKRNFTRRERVLNERESAVSSSSADDVSRFLNDSRLSVFMLLHKAARSEKV